LINEIGQGTVLGRTLGEGAAVTARAFGISRVPVVKGQAIPAHDPRVENGTGVTYCTSAMGADHTAGVVIQMQETSAEAVEISKRQQIYVASIDNLGLCYIAFFERHYPMEKIVDALNAHLGLELSCQDIQEMAKGLLNEERTFNINAGFTRRADRLPDFFQEEPLPPSDLVFNVPYGELDSFWDS
jgi:aldehyde:ferredoxin oxidoreductase